MSLGKFIPHALLYILLSCLGPVITRRTISGLSAFHNKGPAYSHTTHGLEDNPSKEKTETFSLKYDQIGSVLNMILDVIRCIF